MFLSDSNHELGELELLLEAGDESTASPFDVQHEPVQSFRQLFALYARRDQRNRLVGRRRTAQRVHLAIGGSDLLGLTDHHAVDLLEKLDAGLGEREIGAKTGNRLQLVEGAAYVWPSARPDIIRNSQSSTRHERRKHNRYLVADPPIGVLVHGRSA